MASLGKMIKISFPSLLLSFSLLILLVDLANGGPLFPCDPTKGMASFAFCDTTLPIDQRARDLVGRLTLQEKAQQLISRASAVPRLGVPAYQWWSEALHGVSDLGPGTKFGGPVPAATMFPIPLHSAASFNTSLWLSIGRAVSTEARGMYNVGFAGLTYWSPTMNVVRDPRWGRTQETPGEDPLLVGKYAVNYVRGLQDAGVTDPDRLKVAACCKHYTAYDLDNWKTFNRYTFNAKVTEQDLEDTYNPPFKSCVLDGNVASVMCSYNQVNGVPTCADRNLLAGTIRDKWHLNGYIVSDCDSVQVLYNNQKYTKTPEEAAAVALNAGLDLNCDNFLAQHTEAAVNAGLVNESRVDDALVNNFKVLMRLGWFNGDPAKQPFGNLGATDVCSAEHQELALEAARQGVVLLKNLNKALPLAPSLTPTVAVIGPNANVTKTMIGNYAGKACRYTTPLQGISSYVKTVYAPGCANVLCADNSLIGAAAQAAGSADATVLIMGADQTVEKESLDRVSFLLPGHQQDLVTAVTQASKGPVILFIMSGGPFDISVAKEDEKIVGIFWAGYPGQAGGQAMADVIFGAYSPGGKLPVSWYPEEYTNIPMTDMNMRPNPATGYPGRTYRFYTGKTVYKFGDGLSYTSFNHTMARAPTVVNMAMYGKRSCLRTEGKVCEAVRVTHAKCADMFMDVHVDVHNVGSTDSGHVLMLFSSPPSARRRPRKQLLGFRRIHVAAGSTERVHFTLDVCKDLSVADRKGFRKLPVGSYLLHVGGIKHSFDLQINA